MKKIQKIVLSLLLVFSFGFAPFVVKADMTPEAKQELIASLIQRIIQLQKELLALELQKPALVPVIAPAPELPTSPTQTSPSPVLSVPARIAGDVQTVPTLSLENVPDQSFNFYHRIRTTLYSFRITNNTAQNISTSQLKFSIILNTQSLTHLENFSLFMGPNTFGGLDAVSVKSWDGESLVLGIPNTVIASGDYRTFTLYETSDGFFEDGDTVSTSLVDDGMGDSLGTVTITAQ